jgi:CYTH domain-containing protein
MSQIRMFSQTTRFGGRPFETESDKAAFSQSPAMRKNENMPQEKYARIERERRFLLAQFPSNATVVRDRRITDNYIEGTTLRLREQSYSDGLTTFKLTQKLPVRGSGSQQGFITSMYLTQDEFHVLAQLPARKLTKTRFSVPPFGIDVFDGQLQGLILAESEFDSAAAADVLTVPSFVAGEVSADDRFTGGQLVRASRQDIQSWLLDYGVALRSS